MRQAHEVIPFYSVNARPVDADEILALEKVPVNRAASAKNAFWYKVTYTANGSPAEHTEWISYYHYQLLQPHLCISLNRRADAHE